MKSTNGKMQSKSREATSLLLSKSRTVDQPKKVRGNPALLGYVRLALYFPTVYYSPYATLISARLWV